MAAHFTDRELDVMKVLWRHGPATVADVRRQLDDDLAYTTVLTMLRILEEKGHVGHREAGKAHRYFAKVPESAARRSALAKMVDRVFGGSAELLLTHLVADRDLSPDELKRLRSFMDEQIKKSRKS
jgi:BlaI family transcriptional regulator, penicillinase repressor